MLSLAYKRGTSPSADRITSALSPCRTLRQKLRWERISPFHRDRAVPRPSGHQTAPPSRIRMRKEMEQGAGLACRSNCTCPLLIRRRQAPVLRERMPQAIAGAKSGKAKKAMVYRFPCCCWRHPSGRGVKGSSPSPSSSGSDSSSKSISDITGVSPHPLRALRTHTERNRKGPRTKIFARGPSFDLTVSYLPECSVL